MKRFVLRAILVGWVLAWGGAIAQAGLASVIQDAEGGASSVSGVTPGSTFAIVVQVETPDRIKAFEFRMAADTPHVFDLTSQTFEEGWGGGLALPFKPPMGLDPVAPRRIGAPRKSSLATGTFSFVTIQVHVDPAAPAGTYQLSLPEVLYVDANGKTQHDAVTGPAYSVTIAPHATTRAATSPAVDAADRAADGAQVPTTKPAQNSGNNRVQWVARGLIIAFLVGLLVRKSRKSAS